MFVASWLRKRGDSVYARRSYTHSVHPFDTAVAVATATFCSTSSFGGARVFNHTTERSARSKRRRRMLMMWMMMLLLLLSSPSLSPSIPRRCVSWQQFASMPASFPPPPPPPSSSACPSSLSQPPRHLFHVPYLVAAAAVTSLLSPPT